MAHTSSVICFHQRPLTVFASPGRYVQGPGATHELGRELQRLGLSGRVLFVAGRTARRDLQPIWQQVLPEVGLEPVPAAARPWPWWGPAAARLLIQPGPWRMS